ncbi:hypothetical protein [Aquiflexum lacus]|uniref:hypothetical protein n=1 Tax=Aquiflexum lacus TaxID=2483805 RepID=UPI001894C29A|nr:hypothetical protein [Aquiflexum lacus]
MEEPLTISNKESLAKSQDFEFLRTEALQYLQSISGKIWTDYNSHDPGVTILEALCYALTDLGYRSSFPIKDLLAPRPDENSPYPQFFTAAQILPNGPVTFQDYRKIMIDTEVVSDEDDGCKYAGVKNAWIEKKKKPEVDVFVNRKKGQLDYSPEPLTEEPLDLKILYSILLEFDNCDVFGDLNDNSLRRSITVDEHPELSGLVIDILMEFPRWDNPDIDWADRTAIWQASINTKLFFQNLPSIYTLEYSINEDKTIEITGTKRTPEGLGSIDDLESITDLINNYIGVLDDGLVAFYQRKIAKIEEILDLVKSKIQAKRNLCEDFIEFNALRVEEILVCADIELLPEAPIEETEAKIYYEIANFLSPTVFFYTREEMLQKNQPEGIQVLSVKKSENKFVIGEYANSSIEKNSSLVFKGSSENEGSYSVVRILPSEESKNQWEILVKEPISTDIVQEEDRLFKVGQVNVPQIPTEKLYEGPILKHGFIDEEELIKADRRKKLHVSDLIQIIMGIPGVAAVKSIQIANKPQDNESGNIPSKSVKWCLHLAFEQNYVPRLNIDLSKITYYKEQLPFIARKLTVKDLLDEMRRKERPQKIRYPAMDILPPRGTYMDPEKYISVQNEFPLVYGIGEAGLMPPTQGRPDEARARQLKGYLMVFDQLMANFLSQLGHVRDLFSMDPQMDAFGNFLINKTYFSQSLLDIVPNAHDLYQDTVSHGQHLQEITESSEQFQKRRNRFLDHLIARFAEKFTDYDRLTRRLLGEEGGGRLLTDKLFFLQKYPWISANRAKAFDYHNPHLFWTQENSSGLEKRTALMMGVREKTAEKLFFSNHFNAIEDISGWSWNVENDTNEILIESSEVFDSEADTKSNIEKAIISGLFSKHFEIQETEGVFRFVLLGETIPLAESTISDFADEATAQAVIDEVIAIFQSEFFNNPQSNLKNLTPGLMNYLNYSIEIDEAASPPTFRLVYRFYSQPFNTDPEFLILEGEYSEEAIEGVDEAYLTQRAEERMRELVWRMAFHAGSRRGYILDPAPFSSPYHFHIKSPFDGVLLASSTEFDFNQSLVDDWQAGSNKTFSIVCANGTSSEFEILNLEAIGPNVQIELNDTPASGANTGLWKVEETLTILEVNLIDKTILFEGNLLQKIAKGDSLTISWEDIGETRTNQLTVLEIRIEDGNTLVFLEQILRTEFIEGSIVLPKEYRIMGLSGSTITVLGGMEEIAISNMIAFFRDTFLSCEGMHLIEHILLRPKNNSPEITDKLLTINLDETCECALEDPYTCMAHVVLPYWPGRFTNTDFRKLLENKLRAEAPAHVFLTICWVSFHHMDAFEQAYKNWLWEKLKEPKNQENISQALQILIEVLESLRNIYPVGTLHDCDEDENLENSIILNNSALGEI